MKQNNINKFSIKHPKLKKVGFILSIIFAIWGVFLTIILIISIASNSVKNSERKIQNVVYGDYIPITLNSKPTQNAVVSGVGDCLTFRDSEFLNYAVMGFFTYFPGAVTDPVSYDNYTTAEDVFILSDFRNINLNDPLSSPGIMNAHSRWDFNNTFDEGSYNVRVWTYYLEWTNVVYASAQVYVIWMGGVNFSVTWAVGGFSTFTAFFSNQRPGFGMNDSQTFKIMASVYGVDNVGYSTGYTQGYGEGYNTGFTAGQNDLAVNGADPFLLISNAFTSLANILNIKILPWLDLGTLLFTPIIISLIIVVVKMVKA